MSLYKRGEIWWAKLYQGGGPVYKTTKATDKREAQRLHDIWAGELRQGRFLPRADQTRYDQLVDDLLRHYRNTEARDLIEVNTRLAHLNPFFSGQRASKSDSATVARYVDKR